MNLLPLAQLALNGLPNTAIDVMSPFFLRHGYDNDSLMEPTPHPDQTFEHPGKLAATDYARRLRDAQDFAQAAIASAQQRNEQNANGSSRHPERFKLETRSHLTYVISRPPNCLKSLRGNTTNMKSRLF
ncbi:hypothetical protein K3495_g8855 [Podosphaera aphanis]|nr:hypothetical protein K3495_g8855 [Podosphaera aphanis]